MVPEQLHYVYQLTLEEPKRWNKELIEEVFSDRDAQAILNLPLCLNQRGDNLFWAFEKRGEFSVKSANKNAWNTFIALQIHKRENGYEHYGTLLSYGSWWKKLWALAMLPRQQVFAWRLARQVLQERLSAKGVQLNDGCYLCGGPHENLRHLFLECSFTKSVRQAVFISWEHSCGFCRCFLVGMFACGY